MFADTFQQKPFFFKMFVSSCGALSFLLSSSLIFVVVLVRL